MGSNSLRDALNPLKYFPLSGILYPLHNRACRALVTEFAGDLERPQLTQDMIRTVHIGRNVATRTSTLKTDPRSKSAD